MLYKQGHILTWFATINDAIVLIIRLNSALIWEIYIHIFYLPWMFTKFTRSTMQFPIPILWIAGVTVIGMRPSCHPTSSFLTLLLWKHTCSTHNLHERVVLTFKSIPCRIKQPQNVIYLRLLWYTCKVLSRSSNAKHKMSQIRLK